MKIKMDYKGDTVMDTFEKVLACFAIIPVLLLSFLICAAADIGSVEHYDGVMTGRIVEQPHQKVILMDDATSWKLSDIENLSDVLANTEDGDKIYAKRHIYYTWNILPAWRKHQFYTQEEWDKLSEE